MDIVDIDGCTRTIGAGQGYRGLPLKDITINCTVNGPKTPAMISAWRPTPDELARLNAGAAVLLTVLGTAHSPVSVSVSELPCSERPLDRFIAQRCRRGAELRTGEAAIYPAFMAWCQAAGGQAMTLRAFRLAMEARGYRMVTSNIVWWHGLELQVPA